MKILKLICGILPGLALACLLAALSYFAAAYLPISAMLIALFLGFLLHPICVKQAYLMEGVGFGAGTLLKFGIVCLGARINLAMIANMGWQTFFIVLATMALTTCAGVFLGRKMGLTKGLTILIAAAVSVCGSAAALAICSILPREEKQQTDLVFVIVGITLLSTICMVLYPFILNLLQFDDVKVGVILGASLHNVAQAVASGFSVSDEVGDAATIVKLTRVSLLSPYILIISFAVRRYVQIKTPNQRPTILPLFVIGFIALTCLNSFGLIPLAIASFLVDLSKFCLVVSVVAIGIRTSFMQILTVDKSAIKLMLILTVILFFSSIFLVQVF